MIGIGDIQHLDRDGLEHLIEELEEYMDTAKGYLEELDE
tara:strand:+ start:130 stop:246 length:117 start_codon:yes stop_codon:yes gene_type:complete